MFFRQKIDGHGTFGLTAKLAACAASPSKRRPASANKRRFTLTLIRAMASAGPAPHARDFASACSQPNTFS